ncbi:hypothetical protein ACFPMF_15260 [Larkinella bovis]|uniref:Prenyltransferase n=1 Tax=Larkinella bovis TaxID=683041 RepID=A0ABW0IB23_9BACT
MMKINSIIKKQRIDNVLNSSKELPYEEKMSRIYDFLREEENERKAEHDDIGAFIETKKELPSKQRAFELINFYYNKYAKNFGDNEYIVFLISRGVEFRHYQSSISSVWRQISIDKIKEVSFSSTNLQTGEYIEVEVNENIDLESIEVEKSDTFHVPDFWFGDRNERQTIDATMIRVAQWCNISGFDPYWRRLFHETDIATVFQTEDRYMQLQWLYSMCRSEKAINLMQSKLQLSLDILALGDYKIGLPWRFNSYHHKTGDRIPSTSTFIAASLIFCIIRLGQKEKYKELLASAKEFVLRAQGEKGGWKACSFYKKPSIETTALCIHALALLNYDECLYAIKEGANWLIGEQDPWGLWFEDSNYFVSSPFLTVLVLDSLEISDGNTKSLTFDFDFQIQQLAVGKPAVHIENQYVFHQPQIGVVGTRAIAKENSFRQLISADNRLNSLISELEVLIQRTKEKAQEPEEFIALSEVAKAYKAASIGNLDAAKELLIASGESTVGLAKELKLDNILKLLE